MSLQQCNIFGIMADVPGELLYCPVTHIFLDSSFHAVMHNICLPAILLSILCRLEVIKVDN